MKPHMNTDQIGSRLICVYLCLNLFSVISVANLPTFLAAADEMHDLYSVAIADHGPRPVDTADDVFI